MSARHTDTSGAIALLDPMDVNVNANVNVNVNYLGRNRALLELRGCRRHVTAWGKDGDGKCISLEREDLSNVNVTVNAKCKLT